MYACEARVSWAGVRGAALLAITATIITIIVSQMPKMEHRVPLLRLPPLPPQPRDLTVPPPPSPTTNHLPATTTQDNWTALILASRYGRTAVVELLLGSPLMTVDCFNAKANVSGGGGWRRWLVAGGGWQSDGTALIFGGWWWRW